MSNAAPQRDPEFYQEVWTRPNNLTDKELGALVARLKSVQHHLTRIDEPGLQKAIRALAAAKQKKE